MVLSKIAKKSDEELVSSICSGDQLAIEELLVNRCGRAIEYLSGKFDYDELIVDLYIHLSEDNWRRLRTWRGKSSINSWIYQVAVRLCLRKAKEKHPFVPLIDEIHANPNDPANPEEVIEKHLHIIALMEALEQLSPRERRFVYLLFFEEKTLDEVANALRLRKCALYVLKHRVLKKLRRLMEKANGK